MTEPAGKVSGPHHDLVLLLILSAGGACGWICLTRFGPLSAFAIGLVTLVAMELYYRTTSPYHPRPLPRNRDEIFPKQIQLLSRPVKAWFNPDSVAALSAALEALGFECAGDFRAAKMPWVNYRGFVHPQGGMYAVMEDLTFLREAVVELVTSYEDGAYQTCSARDRFDRLDRPPGHPVLRLPGADMATLHAKMIEARPDKPIRIVTKESWADAVMACVASAGVWRTQVEEDRKQFWTLFEAAFPSLMGWSAAEWKQHRRRAAFIHDRIYPRDLFDAVDDRLYLNDDQLGDSIQSKAMDLIETMPARQAFTAILALLPEEIAFEKLTSFQVKTKDGRELEVDAYLAPEEPEEWDWNC